MSRTVGPTSSLHACVLVLLLIAACLTAVVFPARATTDDGVPPAGSVEGSESVVFAGDPSQALVIDRATGLMPLLAGASDLLPLAMNGVWAAGDRLRNMANLLQRIRQRNRAAVEALALANRLVADNVREATVLKSGYIDVLEGISAGQRQRLEREAKIRWNRSAVVRQMTSTDWVCPVAGRTKFRDSWGEPRHGNRRHEGVDLVGFRGDPVLAPVSGEVSHRWDTIGGWSFDLTTVDGDYYFGTHLSGFGNSGEVEAGDVIGFLGDTGNAEGVHLHFEYHPGGRENPVNAYPIVDIHCTNRVEMGLSLYD